MSDQDHRRHRGFGLSLSRDLFGRRGGKALRPAQRQRVEQLLPTLALPMDQEHKLEPKALFADPNVQRYWLEIGFGGGEHLAWQAAHNTDVGMIGAEFYLNGVATALKHIEDEDVASRCRVHLGDGRDVMDKLADQSLERIFILHPDPVAEGAPLGSPHYLQGNAGSSRRIAGAWRRVAHGDRPRGLSALDDACGNGPSGLCLVPGRS